MADNFSILPIQLAPMSNVEKVAQALHSMPAMQQEAAQQMAPEQLKEQNSQLAQAEESTRQRGVKARKDKHSGPQYQWGHHGDPGDKDGHSDEQEAQQENQPEEAAEAPDNAQNVWSGNILNLKI